MRFAARASPSRRDLLGRRPPACAFVLASVGMAGYPGLMKVAQLKRPRSAVGVLIAVLVLAAAALALLWVGDLLVIVVRIVYAIVFALNDIVRSVLGSR